MGKVKSFSTRALVFCECFIGVLGSIYFIFKGLIKPGLSAEMRVIVMAFGFLYTPLIFSGYMSYP